MDLRQLRYFVAVAEEGHITRAAARLGIQQPPLSQQVRALETDLGAQLFRRHPKGVALTTAGEALLADAKRLLQDTDAVVARIRAIGAGRAGVLKIGFTSSAAAHAFTPRVLSECRRTYPDIDLQIAEDHAAGLTTAVLDGKVQCAFLRVPVSRPPGLSFVTLLREPVLVAVPKGHAMAKRKSLSLTDLREQPLILVRQTGAPGLYANLIALCQEKGFEPEVAHEVARMGTALNFVAAGAGLAIIPASMQGMHPAAIEYRELRGTKSLDAPLTLVYRESECTGALKSFVQLARAAAARE
ncbi:LysR family transcriptional regulator [Ramlibacter albus]|uniref:LysR family transcriptional regulator n=1 Tax=Ramlibacter albus TaxID=2079448 RepID=A0A923S2P1_9BURK|nr:LysR family transcriptional regulator [Ramlibacter albus]MBC5764978.1 LysR family transcriptional regulator [Ramlibacter albus]